MTLGDLGASVIKVERPGYGDETRTWGPPVDDQGRSAYYLSVNRNKLSVALDLDSEEDLAVLRRLIADADVVLDNFRSGTLARRGIDPEALLTQHPSLIWCTISGFGPDSDRPGYDFVAQAEGGWMSITGKQNGAPMKVGVALADVIAGKDATIAILAALAARERSREVLPVAARRIHVSLLHSTVASLVNVAQNVLVSGRDAPRWGNAHPNLVPYQLFAAADRPIVIAVGSDAQWRALCRVLDLPALGDDPALATNPGRVAQRDRVVGVIAERVAQHRAEHWLGMLDEAGVPCGVVRTVREALEAIPSSPLTGVSPPVPGKIRLPPPDLDQHGALVRRNGWRAFELLGG